MCLNSAVASRKLIEPRVEVFQNARVAMAIMSADLRAACPLSSDAMFLGMPRQMGDMEADNLDFATHNYSPQGPNEADYCQESFYVQPDPRTGQFTLWRRRNPTIGIDPLSGGNEEEIARGVRGLQFEYYDGYDWYDTWGEVQPRSRQRNSLKQQPNLTGMPEAVRITLWLDPNPKALTANTNAVAMAVAEQMTNAEPPLVFVTVARLNLADVSSQGGGPAAASNSDSNDNGDNSNQGMNQ